MLDEQVTSILGLQIRKTIMKTREQDHELYVRKIGCEFAVSRVSDV
jgi:hypothetical protein